ncbi:hypothetical protein QOZ80_8BG0659460 [Eleusine coracana subsp. coracana]|nr:hypothetical protein QOZ80_8BG0659460 [Eleusine coracana subsp. coracana]
MVVVRIPTPLEPALPARTRLTLAAATADAVMCLFFASMWLTFGATAASDFGCIACGKGCRVVAAASEVRRVAFFSFVFLGPVAFLLFMIRMLRSPPETEKAPAPKTMAEARREALRNPVILVLAMMPFLVLMFLGDQAERNSPHRQRICSLISAVGALGADAMFCFLLIPTVTRVMWRTMACIH